MAKRKKVITALKIAEFNKILIENHGKEVEVLEHDLEFQEELFDMLSIHLECEVLVLLDRLPGPLTKREIITEIINLKREIKIIAVLDEPDDEFVRFLRKHGIFDIFNCETAEILEIVQAILFTAGKTSEPETEKEASFPVLDATPDKLINEGMLTNNGKIYLKKEVITVCSPGGGGGIGKTTIAINLAVLAAKKYASIKVVVADFSEDKPDVCRMTNIESTKGLSKIVQNISNDEFYAKSTLECLEPYGKSIQNLYLLPGLNSLADSNNLNIYHYKEIIKQLKSEFDLVIVDTGAFSTESTYAALDKATKVLFIVRDTEVTVSNLKDKLDFYEKEIGMGLQGKSEILVNMCVGYEKLGAEALREIFGKEVIAGIYYDRDIVLLGERYKPLVLEGSRNMKRIRSDLEKALDQLYTYVEKSNEKRKFLGKLFKGGGY